MAEEFKKTGLMDGMGENNDDDDFKNDPEGESNAKKYRLPFALCKAKGIKIQDWWTPRDAWDALKNGGYVEDVDEEYSDYYDELRARRKKEKAESAKRSRKRAKIKQAQLKNPEHNPDKSYVHEDGKIAGVAKGKPMTFEQADSGNVNPYYGKGYIGYATNCQTCVATFVARRQGYDVRALPNLNNKSIMKLSYNTSLAYVDKNGTHPKAIKKPKGARKAKWLEQNVKNGDIYALQFAYSGKSYGHIVIAQRMDIGGKNLLRIYDPQDDSIHDAPGVYLYGTRDITLTNLTNCRIDEKFCDRIMKGVKKNDT